MWRRSFMWWVSLATGLAPAAMTLGEGEEGQKSAVSPVERWKRFAAAAGLEIPDTEIEAIAAPLERLTTAAHEALQADLGFSEPATCFRFPGGEP